MFYYGTNISHLGESYHSVTTSHSHHSLSERSSRHHRKGSQHSPSHVGGGGEEHSGRGGPRSSRRSRHHRRLSRHSGSNRSRLPNEPPSASSLHRHPPSHRHHHNYRRSASTGGASAVSGTQHDQQNQFDNSFTFADDFCFDDDPELFDTGSVAWQRRVGHRNQQQNTNQLPDLSEVQDYTEWTTGTSHHSRAEGGMTSFGFRSHTTTGTHSISGGIVGSSSVDDDGIGMVEEHFDDLTSISSAHAAAAGEVMASSAAAAANNTTRTSSMSSGIGCANMNSISTLHEISEVDSDCDTRSDGSFCRSFQSGHSAGSSRNKLRIVPIQEERSGFMDVDEEKHINAEDSDEGVAAQQQQQQKEKLKKEQELDYDTDDDDDSMFSIRGLGVKPFVVLVAAVGSIGGIIFGFEIGATSATFLMPGFQENFGWCPADCTQAEIDRINLDQGLINGMFGVGAAIGSVASPWLADKYGRKICMLAGAMLSFYSATRAIATRIAFLVLARFVAGLAVGCLCMCSPVYVAELSPLHARGVLTTLYGFAMTGGVVISSGLNLILQDWEEGWRVAHGGNAFFALLLIVSLITFMPESPRWLLLNGRTRQAVENMRKTRLECELDYEMEILHLECAAEKQHGTATWREMISPENNMRRRVLLGVGLQVVQQFSGINAIMFYAPVILQNFMSVSQAIFGAFILNVLNFLSTFITIPVVDRVGRTTILMVGGVVMILALVSNAYLASLSESSLLAGYFVIFASAIYIIGFAASWGPVVWTVCAEFFPLRARGKGAGLSCMANWICASLMGLLFPIAASASMTACFSFFAVVTFMGVMMVHCFLVETAGRSIAEIDQAYENHKPPLTKFLNRTFNVHQQEQQIMKQEQPMFKKEQQMSNLKQGQQMSNLKQGQQMSNLKQGQQMSNLKQGQQRQVQQKQQEQPQEEIMDFSQEEEETLFPHQVQQQHEEHHLTLEEEKQKLQRDLLQLELELDVQLRTFKKSESADSDDHRGEEKC